MDILKIADQLQIIKIGGDSYLGVLDEEERVVRYAMDYGNLDIKHWFEQYNVGELETLSISTHQGYSVKNFNKPQKMILEKCKAIMGNVKTFSLQYWENQLYNDHYNS